MSDRIKRLAMVAEMEDGKTFLFYTDSPEAEIVRRSETLNDATFDQRGYVVTPPEMRHQIAVTNMATFSYTGPAGIDDGKHLRMLGLAEQALEIK